MLSSLCACRKWFFNNAHVNSISCDIPRLILHIYCHTRLILKFSPTEFLQLSAYKMGHKVVWLRLCQPPYPPTQPDTLTIILEWNILATTGNKWMNKIILFWFPHKIILFYQTWQNDIRSKIEISIQFSIPFVLLCNCLRVRTEFLLKKQNTCALSYP